MKIFAIKVDGENVRIDTIKGCTYVIIPADRFSVTCKTNERMGRPKGKQKHIGRPKGVKNKPKAFKGSMQNKISKYMNNKNIFAVKNIIKIFGMSKAGASYRTIDKVAVAKGFTKSKDGRDIIYSK